MDIEMLARFCCKYREPINHVIIKGGFAWATDGKIGIRAETDLPDSGDSTFVEKLVQAIEAPFNAATSEWEALPVALPMREGDCPDCAGTGKQQTCPSCEGEGEIELDHSWIGKSGFERHSYTVECEECGGTGSTGGEQDGEGGCAECGATGKTRISETVAFGPSWIDSFHLHQISTLPGPIQIRYGGSPVKQMPIRGAGWIGVVMPTREHRTERHPL